MRVSVCVWMTGSRAQGRPLVCDLRFRDSFGLGGLCPSVQDSFGLVKCFQAEEKWVHVDGFTDLGGRLVAGGRPSRELAGGGPGDACACVFCVLPVCHPRQGDRCRPCGGVTSQEQRATGQAQRRRIGRGCEVSTRGPNGGEQCPNQTGVPSVDAIHMCAVCVNGRTGRCPR